MPPSTGGRKAGAGGNTEEGFDLHLKFIQQSDIQFISVVEAKTRNRHIRCDLDLSSQT